MRDGLGDTYLTEVANPASVVRLTRAVSPDSFNPVDWSPDGAWLLTVQVATGTKAEVWLLPVAAAPHAETAARKIISDPKHDLYQPHFSPNARLDCI